jgi:protein TonB
MRFKSSNSHESEKVNEVQPSGTSNGIVAADGLRRCLIEVDPAERGRVGRTRRESLAASALLQVCIVTLLVIAPLFATSTRLVRQHFEVIPPYGGSPQPNHPATSQRPQTVEHHIPRPANPTQITAPTRIPPRIADNVEESWTDPLPNSNDFTNSGRGNSSAPVGLLSGFDGRVGPPLPQPAAPPLTAPTPHTPILISEGIILGKIIHRVEPIYPVLARQARVEGTVQLRAIISKDGSVEHLEVLSGNPLLIRAATDAVLQWRFHPTLLNREPVEVETYFTVVFHLGQ